MSPTDTLKERGQDFRDSELHKLLAKSLKHMDDVVRDSNVIPAKLAERIGFCRFTVYRWLGSNRISPKGAKSIIDISGGRLSREDFTPFLIL